MATARRPKTEGALKFLNKFFQAILFLLIGAYRTIGTTHLGGGCRFEPSCSEYALEAVRLHSPHRAVYLMLKRIARCRPGGAWGFDPVPARPNLQHAKFREI